MNITIENIGEIYSKLSVLIPSKIRQAINIEDDYKLIFKLDCSYSLINREGYEVMDFDFKRTLRNVYKLLLIEGYKLSINEEYLEED